MTHRLLVNPGTPQAWEISLKPGVNRIGRSEQNDFQITHASVSGAHCEIVISGTGAVLRDLGSTNGTFVNRSQVREINLQPGQHVQLGSVDMIFESGAAGAAATVTSTPTAAAAPSAPPPPPPPVGAKPAGLRLSGLHQPTPAATPVTASAAVEEEASTAFVAPMRAAGAVCKFHPKSAARFYCGKCQKYFCDMCVSTRSASTGPVKTCRACGATVATVEVTRAEVKERGFFGAIPGAFVYPFRGMGVLILILAAGGFSAVNFIGWFLVKIALYGFVFLFMQNIIHTTTSNEDEPLSLPDASGLFGAAFQLGATVLASFGLAIGLLIAKASDIDIPMAAIIGATLLGCFYFPMAFLAVAMKDSVVAANPLVVFPAILRMPVEYLVTAILLIGCFGIRQLGNVLSAVAGGISFETKDMRMLFVAMATQAGIALFNVYLLTVTMRLLGLLYNTKKEKFGWFSR